MSKEDNRLEEIKRTIEGLKNTIWAYKFEFTDLDESQRTELITELEKRKRLQEAKLKAIELKKRLSE